MLVAVDESMPAGSRVRCARRDRRDRLATVTSPARSSRTTSRRSSTARRGGRRREGAGHPGRRRRRGTARRRPAVERPGPTVRFSIGVHPHAAGKFAERTRTTARSGGGRDRRPAVDARGGRDRPGLPLRLRAARRPAGRVPGADPPGARAAACRSWSTPARPKTTRSRSWTRNGPATSAASSTASRATAAMARAGGRRRASTCRCRASSPFRRRSSLKEVATAVPLDRLLVETDSLFLAPVPLRGNTQRAGAGAHRSPTRWRRCAAIRPGPGREATTRNFARLFNP